MPEIEHHRAERILIPAAAAGRVMVLDEPLSFWGGFDAETGLITEHRHPQCGRSAAGTILVMRAGRGSSSASSVLVEAIRLGTAPAAILLLEIDEIIVIGAVVADELYGMAVPVMVVDPTTFASLSNAVWAEVSGNGNLDLSFERRG